MAGFGTEFLYPVTIIWRTYVYIAYFTETDHYHEWYPVCWGLNPIFQWDLRDQGIKNEHNMLVTSSSTLHICICLTFSICWLSQSQLLSWLRWPLYWPLLSPQSPPVHLNCVIISACRKTPSSPTALADGCSREEGHMGAGWNWAKTSCSPRDGCTVFLGLHTQRSYAGGLAVWINIEIIAIDSTAHPRTSKKAAHMCLSHVAAPWTGHAQEVSDASGTMRVRRHARGDGVTRYNATRHRRCSTAAPDPRRVLDLEEKSRDYRLKWLE